MNKELEQAMALREEAREALALARQFNEESKNRQQESAGLLKKCRSIIEMVNNPQYEAVYAKGKCWGHVDLGPQGQLKIFNKPNPAPMERDIYDIVHAINVLAMANTDVVDVNTAFFSERRVFCVRFFTKNESKPLYTEEVSLDCDNALQELLAIESQLTELIIEAREAAEAKATEQAEVKA
ncbi:hypothetical protein EFU61_04340 [Vibrio cholerae]|nr:hypothetical protein [Vibrio cholerae]APF80456.1 hypothetical protein ASZ85_02965 [Vibrio cholerae]EAZ75260.1 conserved hypothetical protein [Vibrio cholerae NCTC 8457]EGR1017947.1 hypothetical protein [Vibrio cholerae]ORP88869.1 hypothetical protein B7969_06215 [Vibrio cholerae]